VRIVRQIEKYITRVHKGCLRNTPAVCTGTLIGAMGLSSIEHIYMQLYTSCEPTHDDAVSLVGFCSLKSLMHEQWKDYTARACAPPECVVSIDAVQGMPASFYQQPAEGAQRRSQSGGSVGRKLATGAGTAFETAPAGARMLETSAAAAHGISGLPAAFRPCTADALCG